VVAEKSSDVATGLRLVSIPTLDHACFNTCSVSLESLFPASPHRLMDSGLPPF
jgi:hypothetical protein